MCAKLICKNIKQYFYLYYKHFDESSKHSGGPRSTELNGLSVYFVRLSGPVLSD